MARLRAGERGERFLRFGAQRAVVADEDALKEDLVEQLLDVVVGEAVGAGAVVDQLDRFVQHGFGVLEVFAQSRGLGSVVAERQRGRADRGRSSPQLPRAAGA